MDSFKVTSFQKSRILCSMTSDRLIPALADVLWTSGVDNFELEWRLGAEGPKGFQPGVTKEQWEILRGALDGATCWDGGVHDIQTTEKVVGTSKLVNGVTWNHKTRLFDVDYPPFIRVSGSTEKFEAADPDAERSLPPVTFTRFKDRRSYRHQCWAFDLTKVVSTADIDSDTCTYEVEIELRDPDIFFTRPLRHVIEWGHRLTTDIVQKIHAQK